MKILLILLLLSSQLAAKVLGLGAPCLDYFIPVDRIAYEWGEGESADINKIIEHHSNALVIRTGDGVSNTIKGLASLGLACSLTGVIGDDANGEKIEEVFHRIGIATLFTKTAAVPTSQILCYVTPQGDRSFLVSVEAEKYLTNQNLNAQDFEGAKLVYSSGYRLTRGSYVEKSFELAKKAGALIAFDLGCAFHVSQFRERLWNLLPAYVDILFANADEADALVNLPPKEAASFLKNFCAIAVVKVGEKGCWVCSDEGLFYSPGIPTHTVDTTGAGDLFASGFLYAYLKGESLERCAYLGNLTGSSAVEQFGAELSSDQWSEILSLFEISDCNQTNPTL